ncbi:MAG: pantoate--beta-alanine ligase [Nitrospirae bacterium]|jgi:pantoate--beta-alanine ligase|nr:pantoate--beta-alanine ligase [Nitrospirota bacterium]
MEIIRVPRIMQDTSKTFLLHGKTIGFVPTMGALHDGHLSLVRRAREENSITVVSIFVNPAQFGANEDFNIYPRDLEGDTEKLIKEKVDILFLPDASSIYPEGYLTYVNVEELSEKLCGAFRPGHFRGVTTIVAKLFNIVKPTRAYFGQKDFQQSVIISKMTYDLNMDIDIVVCPTVRDKDGLAMSSRNSYLDNSQRQAATIIYKCLKETSESIKSGIIEIKNVKRFMLDFLRKEPLISEIDYAGIYDISSLEELSAEKENMLLAIALRIGNTRLIDNMLINIKEERKY